MWFSEIIEDFVLLVPFSFYTFSGDPSCSTSSLGGNLVDGLPAAKTKASVVGRRAGRDKCGGKPTFGFNVLVIVLSDFAGALHAVFNHRYLNFYPVTGPPMHSACTNTRGGASFLSPLVHELRSGINKCNFPCPGQFHLFLKIVSCVVLSSFCAV